MFFFRRDIFATIKEIEVTIQRLVLMGILDHRNHIVSLKKILHGKHIYAVSMQFCAK